MNRGRLPRRTAPGTMILLDPHLEDSATADALKATSAKRVGASRSGRGSEPIARDVRLPSARTLSRFLVAAQQAVRLKGQVTVLLTTDEAIRKLNKQFRGKNKATDVLSFPASGVGAEGVAGDLAISVTTALGQAAEQGHTLAMEIKVLVLHGLLHLAGFDHETDDGKMARRERLLRAKLRLPQGLIERLTDVGKPHTTKHAPALKGHGFSRAEQTPQKTPALAAEGVLSEKQDIPRGLKPRNSSPPQSARLKPGPFKTTPTARQSALLKPSPFKTTPTARQSALLKPSPFKAAATPISAPKAKRP